jgi:hypothetical protein
MTVYRGSRTLDGVVVKADGQLLDSAFAPGKMSSLEFEWGYEGAAPARLALALLAAEHRDRLTALACHKEFMRAIVAAFGNEWTVDSGDIQEPLSRQRPAHAS